MKNETEIICLTDFSRCAMDGARVATLIASKIKRELVLVHCLPGVLSTGLKGHNGDRSMQSAQRKFSRAVAQLSAPEGLPVRTRLLPGEVTEVAPASCKEVDAGIIVIGSSRLVGRKWFRDGIAETVAENSTVPTLVVRDAVPLIEWLSGGRTLRVLYGCEPTGDMSGVNMILSLLKAAAPCQLILGCIYDHDVEAKRLGIPAPKRFKEISPEMEALLTRDLLKKANDPAATVRLVRQVGRVDYHLLDVATREKADLIITGSHQWRGIDRLAHVSVSRGLLRKSRFNVLCVPNITCRERKEILSVESVLVPLDLWTDGKDTLRRAASLLGKQGRLIVIHVIHPMALPDGSYMSTRIRNPDEKAHLEMVKHLTNKLRKTVDALAIDSRLNVSVEVIEDVEPARAICQAAERDGADIICMNSRRQRAATAAVLGSVSHAVVAKSNRPVLLLKPENSV